jgi:hypothetical protein
MPAACSELPHVNGGKREEHVRCSLHLLSISLAVAPSCPEIDVLRRMSYPGPILELP